jgi:altronate hydrolase
MTTTPTLRGYLRADGRKGIRNVVAVAYLVECAHHVARRITDRFDDGTAHLIGFPGCYPNAYAERMMERLCTHPNVGAVLLVSLGCECMNKGWLADRIAASGRPVHLVTIQQGGGTRRSIDAGIEWVSWAREALAAESTVPMGMHELVVGTTCGGSDGTSGLTANPAVGRAFDAMIAAGAACVFEETGELIGCERHMAGRAVTPALGDEIMRCMEKAARYYATLGYGSFAVGNADGGLTTIEENRSAPMPRAAPRASAGCSSPATSRRLPGSTCSTWCPTARCVSAFPTSTTMRNWPN